MRRLFVIPLAASIFLLPGCLAKTAFDVVTAPVRVAGKAVDLATTSQSEADEKRGREFRRREERLGKLERRYDQQRARCDDGDQGACNDAQATYNNIRDLLPSVPVEPEED